MTSASAMPFRAAYESHRTAFPLPALASPVAMSSPANSSPFVVSLADFHRDYGDSSNRVRLLDALARRLAAWSALGLRVNAALVGGSFLDLSRVPADIDALLLYSIDPEADEGVAGSLARQQNEARGEGLDIRFCPSDGDPIVLIKAVTFFHTLYLYDRSGRGEMHGSLLIDLAGRR